MHTFLCKPWYRFYIDNFAFFAPPTLKVNGKKGKEENWSKVRSTTFKRKYYPFNINF